MAAKLLIQQGGVTRELSAQDFNSVQYDAQAGTRYELLDDNGDVIRHYTTRVENGKLLIDVAGTSASPDFILNDYTTYFPAPQGGSMGSGYFGTAATESAASTAVKASTVGSTGGSGLLVGGLVGLGIIGGIAVAASGGANDKNDDTNSASQNNTTGNTSNNSASQNNTTGSTNSNSASQNNTTGSTSSNSASQNNTTGNTSSNSANQNNTTGSTSSNSASQNNTTGNTSSNSANQNNTTGSTSSNSASQNNTTSNTNSNSASQNNTIGSNDNNSGSQNNTTGSNSGSQNNTTSSTSSNSGSQNNTTGSTNSNSGSQNNTTGSTDSNSASQTKDVLHGNSIKLPTAYTHKVLSGSDLNAITQAAKGGTELNKYQSSAANQKIIINDLNNLSREVQTELSLFVAQLLNPIRKQWNVGLFKVTDGAMNFAQDVANEYTSNNVAWGTLKGHYVQGITRAAAKYGLSTGGQYYENIGWYSSQVTKMTLDDLKKHLYDIVVFMLFDDARSNHGHAKSLLNAMNFYNQDLDTDYFGVDTSNIGKEGWNLHLIHATDNDAYVKDRTTFTTKIQTPEITSMPATKTAARMVYLDDDNSHLSTAQFADSDDNAPQITQKFTFSQLLEGNVRQLADEYDEQDVLALSQNAFAVLNKDLSNLNEHISYDSATGLLSYDADGVSGSIAPVAFAQLATGLQQEQIQFEIL